MWSSDFWLFSQLHCVSGAASALIFQGRVMFFRCIDIRMAEYISHQINISGFPVEIGAVSASQLVRRDLFQGSDDFRIFFYQVLYAANGHSLSLKGEKESIFVPFFRKNLFPFVQTIENIRHK